MRRLRNCLATATLLAGAAVPASAHIGFILPDSFDYPSCNSLGAVASFSDRFPAPEVALTSATFSLIGPDGTSAGFDRTTTDHAMTRLEGTLPSPGTYRLTSGERLGRKGEVARLDGRYIRLSVEPGEAASLPPGTSRFSSQTATVSEAYVGCGGETSITHALPTGQLSIEPAQVRLKADAPARFTIRFGGEALVPDEAYLLSAYGAYSGEGDGRPVLAGEDGVVEIAAGLEPGIYALLVRHIAPAPDGSETVLRSYSTALTFEVIAPAE